MRIGTIRSRNGDRQRDGELEPAALVLDRYVLPISTINEKLNANWSTDLLQLIETDQLRRLNDWFREGGREMCSSLSDALVPIERVSFGPLYRRPRKIWGIGLNYAAHAADLAENTPNEEPASFMRPDTTIIGDGDTILLPTQSQKTTGEAELGVIMGGSAHSSGETREVNESNWLSVVAGFTTILDMTAEDILRKNPRFLTRSKSFDTFFSFGPVLVTSDEIDDVTKLNVATVINGKVHAENVVANMTFPPAWLVAFHSRIFPWLPGDILSTGTPQAVALNEGDVLGCRISGFEPLSNTVRDLKLRARSEVSS